MDKELRNERLPIERKVFSFSLRENPRGRFLRITEDVGGRQDTIILPASGLEQVRDVLSRMIAAHHHAGASASPAEQP